MVKRSLLVILLFINFAGVSASKDKTVAIILASNLQSYKQAYDIFQGKLKEMNRTNIQFVLSTPNPDPSSWVNALKRAEGHEADFVIVFGAPLVHAAIKEKMSMPIIFLDVYDKDLIEGAKGVQVGGVYTKIPLATLIRSASEIKAAKAVHVLYCPYEKESEREANDLAKFAQMQNMTAELYPMKVAASIPEMKIGAADCIIVTSSVVIQSGLSRLISYGNNHNVPILGLTESLAEAGGILAVAPDSKEQGAMLASYVDNYLKTGKLPQSTQLTKINFIVNLQAAKKLNIAIPFSILNTATRVIK